MYLLFMKSSLVHKFYNWNVTNSKIINNCHKTVQQIIVRSHSIITLHSYTCEYCGREIVYQLLTNYFFTLSAWCKQDAGTAAMCVVYYIQLGSHFSAVLHIYIHSTPAFIAMIQYNDQRLCKLEPTLECIAIDKVSCTI